MYYNKKQIFEFLLNTRESKADNELLEGAFRLVEGLSSKQNLSQYLADFDHEQIDNLVNKIYICIQKRSHGHLTSYGKSPVKQYMRQLKEYASKHADELLVLSAFAKIQYDVESLSSLDIQIIDALRRSNRLYADLDLSEIGEHLSSYSDNQLQGIINNVKGIAHEIKFRDLENADEDSIFATLFEETNHPGTDVQIRDAISGHIDEIQLKATDSELYVTDWIEDHPNGKIVVTEEVAERLGLESSGFSNDEITYDTEDVVDKLIDASDDDSIWDYFPYISAISLSIVFYSIWRRYCKGQIDKQTCIKKCAKATGLKIAKISALLVLMTIPVVNFFTGIYIAFRFISSVSRIGSK
jgi:hypothetical protein